MVIELGKMLHDPISYFLPAYYLSSMYSNMYHSIDLYSIFHPLTLKILIHKFYLKFLYYKCSFQHLYPKLLFL